MSKSSKRAKRAKKALKLARGVITPVNAWTTRVEARNRQGESTKIDADTAVAFCAVGAVQFAVHSIYGDLPWSEQQLIRGDAIRVLDSCAHNLTTEAPLVGQRTNSVVNLNDGNFILPSLVEGAGMLDGPTRRKLRHKTVLTVFDCAADKVDEMYPDEIVVVR